MKIITISRIGYNHPINANWSYGIWKIDTIDTSKVYNMSYVVKETFGGDSRFRNEIRKLTGFEVIETKGVVDTPRIAARSLTDIEDKNFINEIVEFIKNN